MQFRLYNLPIHSLTAQQKTSHKRKQTWWKSKLEARTRKNKNTLLPGAWLRKKADQTHLSKHSLVWVLQANWNLSLCIFFLSIFSLTLCLGSSLWQSGNNTVQNIDFAQGTTVCSVLHEIQYIPLFTYSRDVVREAGWVGRHAGRQIFDLCHILGGAHKR